MDAFYHQDLAKGKRYQMSLSEQLGNIWSEVSRSLQAKENKSDRLERSLDRMLELFDMSLSDPKYQYPQLKEIARLRETICSYFFWDNEYNLDADFLNKYFYSFWLVANRNRLLVW